MISNNCVKINKNRHKHSFFLLFRATPAAYGRSQARGGIGGCQPTPQPQQRRIRALSATYTTAHGNAGSLTRWVRPGIKPTASLFIVRFVSAEPRRELLKVYNFNLEILSFKIVMTLVHYLLESSVLVENNWFLTFVWTSLSSLLPPYFLSWRVVESH